MSRWGNALRVGLAALVFCTTAGGAVIVSTIPAEAHQGTIKVIKTECVDGNTMKATYQWSWSSVPNNSYGTKVVRKTGTTSFEGNWGGSGGSSLVTVNSASGNTTWTASLNKSQFSGTNGPWEYVYAPWSDGYSSNRYNDTRVEGFNWDSCQPPKPADVPDHQKIEKCDLTSYGNNFKPGIIERDGVATYVWNGEKWALGDTTYDKWTQTKVYTDEEYFAHCAGDNPGPKYGEWSDWSPEKPTCEKRTVTQTRTRSVTTYKWEANKKDWAIDEVKTETDTREVSMSDDEFTAKCDNTDLKKVALCDATESATNPYVLIEVSVAAFFNSGHIDHEKDIWAAFSYTKHGETINVAAQGSQKALDANCNVPDKPTKQPHLEYGAYGGDQPTCKMPSVKWYRTVTKTEYSYTFDVDTWTWVEHTTVSTYQDPVPLTKSLTDDQIRECHKADVPTVTVFSQKCTVGDQGVGLKTSGAIVVPESVNYTVAIDGVTDLANVEPGTYSVKLTIIGLQSWNTLPDGWSYATEDHTVIVKNVTVGTAEDCTIQKPPPDPSTYEWGQEAWKCGDIYAVTNGFRTDFIPTWIDNKWVQVAQAPVSVSTQRLLTEAEIVKVCTPASKVESASSQWKDDTIKCGDTKVTQTRYTAKWEIPFVIQWNEDGTYTFVPNYDAKVLLSNTKETQTRDLKSDEITVCPTELAYTGGFASGVGLLGLGALLCGVVLLVALHRRTAQ